MSHTENAPFMAMDLGLKRIGLAFSPDGNITTPLPAVQRKNRNQASSEVKQALDEWQIKTLIVGIPMNGDSEDEMRRRVAHFLNLVAFTGEVFYQDEAESSLEVKALMKGEIKQKRDGRIDSLSAKVILDRYLENI